MSEEKKIVRDFDRVDISNIQGLMSEQIESMAKLKSSLNTMFALVRKAGANREKYKTLFSTYNQYWKQMTEVVSYIEEIKKGHPILVAHVEKMQKRIKEESDILTENFDDMDFEVLKKSAKGLSQLCESLEKKS